MSAIDWAIWAATIFAVGWLWMALDPAVGEIIVGDNPTSNFLTWIWDYGVLIISIIFPSVWLFMRYQKSEYRVTT